MREQTHTYSQTTRIRRLFASIVNSYDRLNRLMSLGRDQAWRRYAVMQCQLPRGGWLLDVATGTGDIALQARCQYPEATIVGIDLTPEMMRRAREKSTIIAGKPPLFLGGDALSLPFPDDRFDAVISGFLMRNVADVTRALAEQRRVVRPGGRVVCLEIIRLQAGLVRWLFWLYFHGLAPLLGGLFSGQLTAYMYLPRSVDRFLTADELRTAMEAVGLRQVSYHLLMLGIVAVHVGVK